MASLGQVGVTLTANTQSLTSGLTKVVTSASAATAGLTALTAAAGLLVAGLAFVVGAASDFEQSIANAGAKAQATEQQMVQLGDAAKAAGLSSAFSAKEAADALGFLAQAGFSVTEQTKALAATLDLASAGNLGVAQASSIAANAINAFRLTAEDAARVSDVLAKAANSADTNVEQLGQALAGAGGIAGATGQQIEGVVAVLSLLQNAGIGAGQAGTLVRSALAKMSDAGGDASAAIQSLGVNVRDTTGNLRQLPDILADMADAGADAGDFIDAFGTKIGPQLIAATAKGGAGLREMTQTLKDAGGTAKEVATRQLDTLDGQLTLLQGSTETLAIAIGETLTPVFKPLAARMIDVTNAALLNEEGFDALTDTVISVVDALAENIDGAAELADSLNVLVNAAKIAFNVWQNFLTLLTIGFDIITGIAAVLATVLVGALVGATAAVETFVRIFDEDLADAIKGATDQLSNMGDGLADLAKNQFTDVLDQAGQLVTNVGDIGDAISDTASGTTAFSSGLKTMSSDLRKGTDELKKTQKATDNLAKTARLASLALGDVAAEVANPAGKGAGESTVSKKVEKQQKKKTRANKKEEMTILDLVDATIKLNKQRETSRTMIIRANAATDKAVFSLSALNAELDEAHTNLVDLQGFEGDFTPEIGDFGPTNSQVVARQIKEFKIAFTDVAKSFGSALAEAIGGALASAGGGVGALAQIGQGAAQGAALGPEGAALGAAAGAGAALGAFVGEMEIFQDTVNRVNQGLSQLGFGEALEKLVEGALQPFARDLLLMIDVFSGMSSTMGALTGIVGGTLLVALKILAVAMVLFAVSIAVGLIAVIELVNVVVGLLALTGNKGLKKAAKATAKLAREFEGLIVGAPKLIVDILSTKKPSDPLVKITTGVDKVADSMDEAAKQTDKMAKATEKANEALTNVPTVFKLNLRRAQAIADARRTRNLSAGDPAAAGLAAASATGAGGAAAQAGTQVFVSGDLIVEGEGGIDKINEQIARRKFVISGSKRTKIANPFHDVGSIG